jgi:hypothetical protein
MRAPLNSAGITLACSGDRRVGTSRLCGKPLYPFTVNSRWHQGETEIVSFEPEELFATSCGRSYSGARTMIFRFA